MRKPSKERALEAHMLLKVRWHLLWNHNYFPPVLGHLLYQASLVDIKLLFNLIKNGQVY